MKVIACISFCSLALPLDFITLCHLIYSPHSCNPAPFTYLTHLFLVLFGISHSNPRFPSPASLRLWLTCIILPAFPFQLMPLGIEQPVAHMERLSSSYSRIRAVNPECLCCWGRFFASKPRLPFQALWNLSVYPSSWFPLDPLLSWSLWSFRVVKA